ncbi:MAG: histidine phosphatase family protein [Defluviicoccus sp.]
MIPFRSLAFGLVSFLAAVSAAYAETNHVSEAAWAALAGGGHAALMRHATAPGFGDPKGFRLDDCSTQRNLSEAGREEARMVGERFRSRGIAINGVYSSVWCRCLETARLLDLGPVVPLAPLNSFFEARERAEAQTAALRAWLAAQPAADTLVLVTHQVNITALTGIIPASGEIVVVRTGSLESPAAAVLADPERLPVVGRIAPSRD